MADRDSTTSRHFPKKDLTGRRYHRWTVLELGTRQDKHGVYFWKCCCDCGTVREVHGSHLVHGQSMSCGCIHKEHLKRRSDMAKSHRVGDTPEYNIWSLMKRRCCNPNAEDYPRYGGRGVKVCDRWRNSFASFLEDMGPRPGPEYSIDRIDNDGDYEPGNCRWATVDVQARNRRNNVVVTIGGRTMVAYDWLKELDIPVPTYRSRVKAGMTPFQALTVPVDPVLSEVSRAQQRL